MLPAILAGTALAGAYLNNQTQRSQIDSMKKAQDLINSVPLPVLKEYYPELYKQVVDLVPEAAEAVNLESSSFEDIKTDDSLKQAQLNALNKLQEISDSGGMTATDKARLGQIQAEQNANLKGQQGAIMQNLAARGLSGGMSEMVARQLSAQEAANREAQMGMDVKAQAEQRALDALIKSGELGGSMQQQQFDQASQIAAAKDYIKKFNAENLQNVRNQNIQARNQAQEFNARNKQDISNQNVDVGNKAQMYNIGLPQQQYQNELSRATGQAQGATNIAQQQAANQAANMQFVGGLLQTGANYYGGQQQKKKNPYEV